jgi:flagellar protein FliT
MIRQSLTSWKTITEQLLHVLHVIEEDKRDIVMDQVNKLLDEREALQSSIHAPFTDREQLFGQALLPLEEELDKQLKLFRKAIRSNISEQQKKKVSMNAYMDPYSQVFRDGTFYDKKK